MDFKAMLDDVKRAAGALAAAAATLENQNLADIIKSAAAKLGQASEHPDVDAIAPEAVHEAVHEFERRREPPLPFGSGEQHGA